MIVKNKTLKIGRLGALSEIWGKASSKTGKN